MGQIFAEFLGAKKGVKIILSGRSTLDTNKKRIIKDLCKDGADIGYLQSDVCNKEDAKTLVRSILEKYGKLTGVIHSAGVIHDSYIHKKTPEEIRAVIGPKVGGILAIEEATQKIKLDFVVLFSSISGTFGNPGQADYAGANSFLDAFAEYRNQRVKEGQCFGKTTSLNWPLWKEGGMILDPQSERLMEQRTGMTSMDTQTGIHTFVLALREKYGQVLVASGNAEKVRSRLLKPHLTLIDESEPKEQRAIISAKSENSNEFLTKAVHQELIKLVSDQLMIKSEKIELETELSKFGFDSISLTEFANRLNGVYGLELMPHCIF